MAAIEAAVSSTPVLVTPKYSVVSTFLKASASLRLKASQLAFSLAMMSLSDGPAIDFISPPRLSFAVILVLPAGWLVQATANSNEDTNTKSLFIIKLLGLKVK